MNNCSSCWFRIVRFWQRLVSVKQRPRQFSARYPGVPGIVSLNSFNPFSSGDIIAALVDSVNLTFTLPFEMPLVPKPSFSRFTVD
jgi:hypothetical protein